MSFSAADESYMKAAMAEAKIAASVGEVPVGAVIVSPDGQVVAAAGNRTRELHDPTAHAEIMALRAACIAKGSERLNGYDLYVTLEPCTMCAAAIAAATETSKAIGFDDATAGSIATAVSEVAWNIVKYARFGEIVLRDVEEPSAGLEIVARDSGPGIDDLDEAMSESFSTSGR